MRVNQFFSSIQTLNHYRVADFIALGVEKNQTPFFLQTDGKQIFNLSIFEQKVENCQIIVYD